MTATPGPAVRRRRLRLRVWLPIAVAVVLLVPLGVLWWSSLLPSSLSVMQMGDADFGTGGRPLEHDHGDMHGMSVTDLVADPSRRPDVKVDLHAAAAQLAIGTAQVAGYTVNGTSPGPTVRAREGQLIEVRFTNDAVPDGVTLHWHGVSVPNAMDGVAGVTQDALAPGQSFTYRFVASQAGTYWYHSHQVSHQQVIGGLYGALVIEPKAGAGPDAVAMAHTYGGVRAINGRAENLALPAEVGRSVRVRVVNTDNATLPVWSSGPVVVAAIDGNEVNQPTAVEGQVIRVPAGGRVDLLVSPTRGGGVRIQLSKATAVIVSAGGADPAEPEQPTARFDALAYGRPADVGFDPTRPDRHFDYLVTQLPGFVKGRPGVWWAINGKLYPNVGMFVVAEGELVGMHLANSTSEVHPMHLHGHRVLVTARNAETATGSPWWTDSFEMQPGESYDIVFRADNPGIWMDHCHNLDHARDGMVAHLAYAGVTTPFVLGGTAGNEPE
ncbi:MAG TPA: multicopper oxidase family protein [Propionicimonas sp.]|nr:multicopper oxidase family protein [Propionicimonas sp.]